LRFDTVGDAGTGAATTLEFAGYYGNLRSVLLAWGDAHGYSFSASAAAGIDSKSPAGFAAEGMAFAPNNTTLYIGLRAPLKRFAHDRSCAHDGHGSTHSAE
jgi:hypothetical protein